MLGSAAHAEQPVARTGIFATKLKTCICDGNDVFLEGATEYVGTARKRGQKRFSKHMSRVTRAALLLRSTGV
ncbi:MAG: hypothetical protein ACI84R_000892 [Candidatus Azotimanducaceae bacterium]|jgi:hypothetical protein